MVAGPAPVQAQYRLPDTPANRSRGVVGCIQTSTGITCPDRGGAGVGGGDAGAAFMFGILGGMIHQTMQEALSPTRDSQQNLQQQEQLRRQQEQWQAEEAARRQKAEEEKAKIAAARERILRQLRPVDGSDPSLGAGRELQVIEGRGAFGTTEIKPRDLTRVDPQTPGTQGLAPASGTLQPRTLDPPRKMTAFERAACSRQYLLEASRRFNENHPEEAAALSREAGMIMTGEATPSVPCASSPANVPAAGDPVMEQKQALIMSALFTRISEQTAEYRARLAGLKQAQQNRMKLEQEAAAARARLEELRAVQPPPRPGPSDPTPAGGAVPDPAKQSALDEALRALRESEEALSGARQAETGREAEVGQSKRKLEETSRLTNRASAGPEAYDDLMQRLDLKLPADPS